jgi:hypothetical protein
MFQCQALSSRRFERGFDRVKVQRHTGWLRVPVTENTATAAAERSTAMLDQIMGNATRQGLVCSPYCLRPVAFDTTGMTKCVEVLQSKSKAWTNHKLGSNRSDPNPSL